VLSLCNKLESKGIVFRFAEGTGNISPLKMFQIASGAQSVSHSIGVGGFSPLAKLSAYEPTNFPPTSSLHLLSYGGV
jgi:hypothetical protein